MPKAASARVQTTLRIPDALKADIKAQAKKEARSESAMMLLLLERGLRKTDATVFKSITA